METTKTKNNVNERTLSFELKIEGVEDKIKREITIIDDIKAIDLFKWCTEFEEMITCNKWSRTATRAVVSNLIKDERITKLKLKDSWDKIKKQLFEYVYPKNEERLYKKRLSKIYQTNFKSIQEYYDQIEKIIKIISTLSEASSKDIEGIFEDAFYNGLGRYTYGKIIEMEFLSFHDCFEYLRNLEDKVIIRAREMAEGRSLPTDIDRGCESVFTNKEFSKGYKPSYGNKEFIKPQNTKYCKLHRECNHTTEECTKYDRDFYKKKEQNSDKQKERNFLIKESVNNPDRTAIKGRINNQELEFRIDSGASKSFMKKSTAEKLNLKIMDGNEITTIFGNGETEISNLMVEIEIKMNGLKRTIKERFYILNDLPEEVLIGNEFLFNNEIVLDYKNKIMMIDKCIITMTKNEGSNEEELEQILFDRLLFIEDVVLIEESKIKEALQEYIRINDEFKCINIEPIKLFTKQKAEDLELRTKYYSVPHKYEEGAKAEINRLLQNDIIEENRAPYASPSFLLEKKNKELRLVVDYRLINETLRDEICQIPKIFENLYRLGPSKFFSKIDLKNGFNQIRLAEESRDLTSFTMLGRQYRYKRIPFGIKVGPKLFQRVINKILDGVKNCIVYIDDIIMHGETIEEHNKCLLEVLERLKSYRVKINFDKSKFLTKKLDVLGSLIENGEIRIDTENINRLISKDIKIRTKREIQKIIGIITWYRNFIPDVSRKTACMTRLLKNDCEERWGQEQDEALKRIKDEIINTAQLKLPDVTKRFFLQCDASMEGMGAVLFQEHGVIGYYSKKFNKIEQNYTIVEKEMYSIVRTLEFFRGILLGCIIEIETDSRNCIFANRTVSTRMERWKLIMNDFDIKIRNIKGTDNVIADNLSRCYLLKNIETESLFKIIKPLLVWDGKEIIRDEIGRYRVKKSKNKLFIELLHEWSIHTGMSSLYYSIKDLYNVVDIKKTIKEIIEECELCMRCKKKKKSKRRKQYSIEATKKMEIICSDVFGPFDLSNYQHNFPSERGFILTITDVYSRFTSTEIFQQVTSEELLNSLEKWIHQNGVPKRFICDNGKQYSSKKVDDYLKKKNIQKIATPMYHPSSNGISERLNQTVCEVLRLKKGSGINEVRKCIMRRLNYNYHRFLGTQPIAILSSVPGFEIKNVKGEYKPRESLVEKKIPDNGKDLEKIVKVGDKIFVKNFNGGKLEDLFIGPLVVEEVSERNIWMKVKEKKEWIHIDDIKITRKKF